MEDPDVKTCQQACRQTRKRTLTQNRYGKSGTRPTIIIAEYSGVERSKGKGWAKLEASRVVEMLHSPTGTTIAAVMKATGWQQHSVRGFFAGVVQKKLRLKLDSRKIDGNRIYRIVDTGSTHPNSRRPSRQSA